MQTASSTAATLFAAPSDAAGAALATLAATGPVVRIPLPGGKVGWLVTGYADVRDVLTDPRVVKETGLVAGPFVDELPPGVAAGLFRHMLNANPPDHGRPAPAGRGGVHPPPGTRRWRRGSSRSPTACWTGPPRRAGPVDLVEALAAPLPVRVIGELLGVPEADFPRFRAWTRPLVTGVLAGRDAYVDAAVGCSICCVSWSPEAQRTRRRPAVRPDRRPGWRRPARRGRADLGGVPAARRRPRDHRQPDRERRARAAHAPRPARPAAGPAGPAAGRRRGGAALRRTGPGRRCRT